MSPHPGPGPTRSSTARDQARRIIRARREACGICGQPIDYSLPSTDPRSFVVDHRVPLKLGGSDAIENKQAAHRYCNSTKRARLIAPIVKRSNSLH